jgi:hypothetical protein
MITEQVLTEKMLMEWTGLKGRELSMFYLEYKNQASNILPFDIEYIKQDIIDFKELFYDIYKPRITEPIISEKTITEPSMSEIFKNINVKNLINMWESKKN